MIAGCGSATLERVASGSSTRFEVLEPVDLASQSNQDSFHGSEIFSDANFVQSAGIYGEHETYGEDENFDPSLVGQFWVRNQERDPGTDERFDYRLNLTASFEIIDVQSRCANDYFVRGRDPDSGAFLIERWRISMPDGAWVAPREISSAPIGTSVSEINPPVSIVQGGGGFVPPANRGSQPRVQRDLILRLPTGAPMTAMDPDPDGRFVVFSDGLLVKRLVLGESTPSTLGSSVSLTLGVHQITELSIGQNADAGRCMTIQAGDYDYVGLLIDDGNHGDFEGVLEYSISDFVDAFPYDSFLGQF